MKKIDIIKILRNEEKNGLFAKNQNQENIDSKKTIPNNKMDALLEDRNRLLDYVFDAITDGISVLNKDLTIKKTNQFMKETYENSIPLEGKKCYQIYQKRSNPCPRCPSIKAMKTGIIQREIVPYPTEKDPIRWFQLSSYPIIEGNKSIGVIEHVKDITNFKKTEKSLRKNKEILNQLIVNTNQVFYTHDINHKINYISPKCMDMFGYTADEMKLKWTLLTTNNPMNEKGYRYTEKAIKTGEKQDPYNLELTKKNGKTFIVEVNESPIKDEKGNVVAMTGSLNDVTEKKIAEKKLYEKITALETFHEMGVRRELRMIQLKKEINSLCKKIGEPNRYDIKDENEINIEGGDL